MLLAKVLNLLVVGFADERVSVKASPQLLLPSSSKAFLRLDFILSLRVIFLYLSYLLLRAFDFIFHLSYFVVSVINLVLSLSESFLIRVDLLDQVSIGGLLVLQGVL